MVNPRIRYLVSSPCGDIPAEKDKWDLPLECDQLKTPYGVYFHSINDFLSREGFRPLIDAASKKLGRKIHIKEINEIIIRTEKHGLLYHPASIELILKEGKVKFGLNVAVSEFGKDCLKKEFSILKKLYIKFNLPYLPEVYYLIEQNSMVFLLEEWFEGYHEFHISQNENGKTLLKLWEFGKGYKYLSTEQSFEIFKQASKILTLYYDFDNYCQIQPWHHAAGDFIAKIEDEVIDVRLTTARQYEPFMVFRDKEKINPVLALLYFLLILSIRMRLDKLDGLGKIIWIEDYCVEATVTGFLEALKLRDEFSLHLGSEDEFLMLIQSFDKKDLKTVFEPLLEIYSGTEDFPVIIENIGNHIGKLYTAIQNLPS
ncbi:MAG: hypothetical protein A2Y97_05465 [Nitrospirae bacterium RBG_13_39_12]|nr:MAG: hypothetical protein A2Y97_05465 [Nitrospirae bacterium RBG_13_39_12]